MDSPDAADKIASASKASPSKDSPFYNYLSNLSPINQTKDTRVGQRLFHVSSPPPVFTSPREPKLLERLQNSETATAGLLAMYRTDDEMPTISQSTTTEAQVMLIPYSEAFNKVIGDAENQSPPGSIDKYLADPSEECENFLCSPNLCSEKVAELPQISKPSAKCGEERCFKNDGSESYQKDGNIGADLQSSSVENTPESSLKGNFLADANPNKSAGDCFVSMDQIIDKASTKIVQHTDNDNVLEAGSSHLSASAEDRYLEGTTAIVICGNECDKDMHAASPSTHMSYAHEVQAVEEQKNDMTSQGNLELDMVPCSDLVENIELDRFCMDKVEMEAQRGARRRCLQFQAGGRNMAKFKSSGFSTVSPNMFQETGSPKAPEALNINPCGKIDGAVGNELVAYPCQRAVSATELHASSTPQDGSKGANFSTDVRASTSVGTPISLGIGLHLNSIGKAGVSMNVQKGQYLSERSHPLTEDSKGLLAGTSLRNNLSQITPHDLKSVCHSPPLNIGELSLAPTKKKESAETDTCKVEDIDGMSPKKKRKRSAYSSGDEGCRRCNCKKSKCLKLYCECFAAGVYCSDPCTCQDCFNKPEYEDTVLGTRQQIESRNPLAFAPRVVHCVIGSPQNVDEEGTRTTPASARHKRGCNCKKSMCLKKYCECFQAGVGCSDGCRCEGCKNVFGRKEGLGIISYDHLKTESMRWNREAKGKLESADAASEMEPLAANDDTLQLEHCPMDPPSPRSLFRCSNREIVLPRSWQHSRRHLTSSPDSESSAASSYGKSPNSPMKSSLSVRIVKTSVYVEDVDIQMPVKSDIMASSWNGLIDRCNVLPTGDYQSMRTTTGSNPCLRSSQALHSHVRLSKAHDSPITPISRFCETKYVGPSKDSSSKNLEDETPEILKEKRSPIKAVKASSPNQKRVSPPHECLQGIRSTISPSLRSGRRFILQSVPSFPPLTPYSDSKETEK